MSHRKAKYPVLWSIPYHFINMLRDTKKKSSAMGKRLYQCQTQKWYNLSTFPRYYSPKTFMCYVKFFDHKDIISQVPCCSGQEVALFWSYAGDPPVLSFSGRWVLTTSDHFLWSCPQLRKPTSSPRFLWRQTNCRVAFHFSEFGINLTKFTLLSEQFCLLIMKPFLHFLWRS